MASRFNDRVVAVTGGAGGIGAAAVKQFHAEGARVAILDLSDELGGKLAAELNVGNDRALFVRCDVTNEANVTAAFAEVAAKFGGAVDVLVCMAAVFVFKEVHETSSAEWDKVLSVNIKGAAFCIREVLPGMRAKRRGAIVTTASITGTTAFPAFVPYSATKAALIQMTRDMALDNGKFGIRVNCCAPGPIFTDGGTVAHAKRESVPVEEICASLSADVALRRMGTIEECAKGILFLASEDASYVTGTVLHVDGGFFRK